MNKTDDERAFVGYLEWLLEQEDRSAARAAMAHLRRGLGEQPGTVYEMDRYVLNKVPEQADEQAYYLVAALFSFWHQGKEKSESLGGKRDRDTDRNLGRSLKNLATKYTEDATTSLDDARKRLEKRLNALLEANREDLGEYLRHTVSLFKSRDVPVNWVQLLHDIQHWNPDRRDVQHAWAKGFWVDDRKPEETMASTKATKIIEENN